MEWCLRSLAAGFLNGEKSELGFYDLFKKKLLRVDMDCVEH